MMRQMMQGIFLKLNIRVKIEKVEKLVTNLHDKTEQI